ncbi:hypothetical protein, partial [Salmonella enterica]|uniref:hypothetical protein n=1 Tax=Salmonella enterica TaxID=28901 RepID=UPI0032E4BB82
TLAKEDKIIVTEDLHKDESNKKEPRKGSFLAVLVRLSTQSFMSICKHTWPIARKGALERFRIVQLACLQRCTKYCNQKYRD